MHCGCKKGNDHFIKTFSEHNDHFIEHISKMHCEIIFYTIVLLYTLIIGANPNHFPENAPLSFPLIYRSLHL